LAVSSYQLVVGSRQLAGEGWSDPKKGKLPKGRTDGFELICHAAIQSNLPAKRN